MFEINTDVMPQFIAVLTLELAVWNDFLYQLALYLSFIHSYSRGFCDKS